MPGRSERYTDNDANGSRNTVRVANILGGMVTLLFGLVIRACNAIGLIAGYNTASAEEQALYDERALTGFVEGSSHRRWRDR